MQEFTFWWLKTVSSLFLFHIALDSMNFNVSILNCKMWNNYQQIKHDSDVFIVIYLVVSKHWSIVVFCLSTCMYTVSGMACRFEIFQNSFSQWIDILFMDLYSLMVLVCVAKHFYLLDKMNLLKI